MLMLKKTRLSYQIIMLAAISIAIFSFNPLDDQITENNLSNITTIEFRNDAAGLTSHLMRIVEWMYCVKQNKNIDLYVNLEGFYGFKGNTFLCLFKEIEDPLIKTSILPGGITHQFSDFPRKFQGLNIFPTDGMKYFHETKYVYCQSQLYKDPDFSLFRRRLHPFIKKYLRPLPELQEQIDLVSQKMNSPTIIDDEKKLPESIIKIGIHVRCQQHYLNCHKSQLQFLNDIERDVDEIMKLKNPKTTRIYLATLVEPLAERLSAKYDVVMRKIPRIPDAWTDWTYVSNVNNIEGARDTLIDLWCLGNCDEVWGGSSNMMIFAGCLNPDLKIEMLPSLMDYDGS